MTYPTAVLAALASVMLASAVSAQTGLGLKRREISARLSFTDNEAMREILAGRAVSGVIVLSGCALWPRAAVQGKQQQKGFPGECAPSSSQHTIIEVSSACAEVSFPVAVLGEPVIGNLTVDEWTLPYDNSIRGVFPPVAVPAEGEALVLSFRPLKPILVTTHDLRTRKGGPTPDFVALSLAAAGSDPIPFAIDTTRTQTLLLPQESVTLRRLGSDGPSLVVDASPGAAHALDLYVTDAGLHATEAEANAYANPFMVTVRNPAPGLRLVGKLEFEGTGLAPVMVTGNEAPARVPLQVSDKSIRWTFRGEVMGAFPPILYREELTGEFRPGSTRDIAIEPDAVLLTFPPPLATAVRSVTVIRSDVRTEFPIGKPLASGFSILVAQPGDGARVDVRWYGDQAPEGAPASLDIPPRTAGGNAFRVINVLAN
jgi:hypothetical protein